MRILFVHDRIGAQAGAESNIFHSAIELKRRGHSVGLVHGPTTHIAEDQWREVFRSRFGLHSDMLGEGMGAALQAFDPDVIYLHNSPGLPIIAELAVAGRPVVRMVHDHHLFCMRGCKYTPWSRRPCTRSLSPFCCVPCGGIVGRRNGGPMIDWSGYASKKRELTLHRQFRTLVVGSDYMRDELLRNGFARSQIEVLAPVPPVTQFAVEPTFGKRNLIVYAGQLVRGKGVDILLECLARVTVPFECIILGDGNHRAHCEALSKRLGLSDRVSFRGYVEQETLRKHYQEATLAVVSSVWPEPFGATGLEAMRCGLPIVAFDVGGIREWLVDGVNGFLIPWMDREDYARCIDVLLEDKGLARRLGTEGRRLASERFGFESYIDSLETLLSRVYRDHPHPQSIAA